MGDRHDAPVDADTATPGSVRSQGGQENGWGAGTADASAKQQDDGNVVDAEYEEVKDKK